MRRFPLPFQPKSPTCTRRERQKKLRKSGLTDRILPSAQTASESHSMRLHERVAKGGAATVNGDECRSWAGHQVMLARVPHHQTTAIGRPSPPAAPGPRRLPCTSRPHQVAPLVPGQGVAYPVRSVACAWHNRQPLQLSAEKALHGPCPRMRATGCPLGQSPKTPRVFGGANRRI